MDQTDSNAAAANDAVRQEWMRRIEAEYCSAAHAQHLTLWLIQLGFPRELINDGLRIVQDELDHAELSAIVYQAAGGSSAPVLLEQTLALNRRGELLRRDALLAVVDLFCLGETLAVPLFKELRSECTVPTARKALDRILRDEVRHRQFGWDVLDYFLDIRADSKELVTDALPALFARLIHLYGRAPKELIIADRTSRAWGLMPLARYRAILFDAMGSEILPRFAEHGISAAGIWATQSQRAASP